MLALAILVAGPSRAQELRGFLTLEGGSGYLTNAYLDPTFATWAPRLQAAFGSLAGTGGLSWSGERTTASALAGVRWIGFADSTSSWSAAVLSGEVERRLGGGLALAAGGAFSELRRPDARRSLWARGALRWTASPGLRLGLGPAVARTRLERALEEDTGPLPGLPAPGGGGEPATATSVVLLASVEAWPGGPWRLEGEAYGARTEADDLGVDYRGGGGSLRATRWWSNGASVTLGTGIEGFGYRAALDGSDESEGVPENDLIVRGEVGVEWPLARRLGLQARLAGLGRPSAETGDRVDLHASLGLRFTIDGTLSSPRRRLRWSREPEGMRIRVRYAGDGRLYLVGDFNGWDDPGLPLRRTAGDTWTSTLRLEPGSYRYRVRVVEGEAESWLPLPEGTVVEEDGFGGGNAVLVIEDGDR